MITKYILVETLDKEIVLSGVFSSQSDAHRSMCQIVASAAEESVENVVESYLAGDELNEYTCILEDRAFCDDYDWKILCVNFEDNESVVS